MNNNFYPSIKPDATKDQFEMREIMETYQITHLAQPIQPDDDPLKLQPEPFMVHTVCGLQVSPLSCVENLPTCEDCMDWWIENEAFPEDHTNDQEALIELANPQDHPGLSLSEQYPNETLGTTEPQQFAPGDRVKITSHGFTKIGEVTHASNYPSGNRVCWNIKMIDDDGYTHYWKSDLDGGTIEPLQVE